MVAEPSPDGTDKTCGVDPNLIATLRTLGTQFQLISDQLSAAFPKETLTHGAGTDEEDHFAKISEIEESWEVVWGALNKETQQQIDSWKEELDNVLIFAGLFSAVATTFVAGSYVWLQQDSGDISNAFLAHISLQLSSFTLGAPVANVPGLLNSSIPALSLQDVASSFSPSSLSVSVNFLWILSLTLSLISAFSAITVQQWLRHVPLQKPLPIRVEMQLGGRRAMALVTWQVDWIISLLPLLLQIAVALFLVGLFLLLQSLNGIVSVAFAVVALLALLVFIITTVAPLFIIACPYKSNVVPAIILTALWPFYLIFHCLNRVGNICDSRCGQSVLARLGLAHFYKKHIHPRYDRFYKFLTNFDIYMILVMKGFWSPREHASLGNTNRVFVLVALFRVLLLMPVSAFRRGARCFRDLSAEDVQGAVTTSVCALFGSMPWDMDIWVFRPDSLTKLGDRICGSLSARHHFTVWEAIKQRSWAQGRRDVAEEDAHTLTLFHHLDKIFGDEAQRSCYMKHLLHVCANQSILSKDRVLSRAACVPACLVFDAIQRGCYPFDRNDASSIVNFAFRLLEDLRRGFHPQYPFHPSQFVFVSSASALIAINMYPSIATALEVLHIIQLLNFFYCDLQQTLDIHEEPNFDTILPLNFPQVIRSLCASLDGLVKNRMMDKNAAQLSSRLRHEICHNLNREIRDNLNSDLVEALKHLDAFDEHFERAVSVDEKVTQELEGGGDYYLALSLLIVDIGDDWLATLVLAEKLAQMRSGGNNLEHVAVAPVVADELLMLSCMEGGAGALLPPEQGIRGDGPSDADQMQSLYVGLRQNTGTLSDANAEVTSSIRDVDIQASQTTHTNRKTRDSSTRPEDSALEDLSTT